MQLLRSMAVALAAACLAGGGNASWAAEPVSSLGAAFRPQAPPPPPPVESGATRASAAEPAGASPSGLRVLVTSATRSLASIDGRIVRVGDVVNGMRVAQIHAQGVVLVKEDGVREQLSITPAAVKRPAHSIQIANGGRP